MKNNMMTTRRQAEILWTVIFSSIIIILSSSFLFALPDDAGTSIIFKYPSADVVNYTTVNVNNSQFLRGYTPTNLPYASYSFGANNFNGSGSISIVDGNINVTTGQNGETDSIYVRAYNSSAFPMIRIERSSAIRPAMIKYTNGNTLNWYAGIGYASGSNNNFYSLVYGTTNYASSAFAISDVTKNVGLSTINIPAKLTVNGSIMIMANTTSQVCNSTYDGMIYYNGALKKHYGCNSSTWNALY